MKRLAFVMLACGGTQKPAEPPPPPTCAQAADHMRTLLEPQDELAQKIRDVFQLRCLQDEWSAEPRACIVATKSLGDKRGCKGKLTVAQRETLERDLAEAERVARASKLPASCEKYKQVIEELVKCDKLPQSQRDALAQGFAAMAEGWKDIVDMPPETKTAMESACKAASDALQQAAGQLCGLTP